MNSVTFVKIITVQQLLWKRHNAAGRPFHISRRGKLLRKSIFTQHKYLQLSAALSSATQHAMPPEFGRKWETECLNTRFPLPTYVCGIQRDLIINKYLYANPDDFPYCYYLFYNHVHQKSILRDKYQNTNIYISGIIEVPKTVGTC